VNVALPLIAKYPTKRSCVIAGTCPDPSSTEGLVLRIQEGRGIGNPHVDMMYRVRKPFVVYSSMHIHS